MNFLISPNQIAFIKGRYILESVVSAHEVIHSVSHGKQKGAILKLDYEKAFDKVNLDFLDELLVRRKFSPAFCSLIKQITREGQWQLRSMEWRVIPLLLERQGDPLSPLLFNLVVDVFTRMLIKAASHNLIRGLCPNLIPRGVISL
jgi:hypothetical protein